MFCSWITLNLPVDAYQYTLFQSPKSLVRYHCFRPDDWPERILWYLLISVSASDLLSFIILVCDEVSYVYVFMLCALVETCKGSHVYMCAELINCTLHIYWKCGLWKLTGCVLSNAIEFLKIGKPFMDGINAVRRSIENLRMCPYMVITRKSIGQVLIRK